MDITLGAGISFSMVYNPRLLIIENGRHRLDFENKIFDEEDVRLWRYSTIKSDTIRAGFYWSELKTDYLHLAGEATGIGDNECVWRAEWTFPISEVLDRLVIGSKRMSQVGWFREYRCNEIVPADQITWKKMKTGTAGTHDENGAAERDQRS